MPFSLFRGVRPVSCAAALLSGAILSFGLYHIHSRACVTEGGILGLTLLLEHWLSISPAITNLVLSLLCYFWGWRLLGRKFVIYSALATASFWYEYERSKRLSSSQILEETDFARSLPPSVP